MDTKKIEELLTIEEIKNLRVKYTHFLDANQIEEASMLFAEDTICQTDREPWNGRAAVKEGLQKAFNDFDIAQRGRYPFLHVISNQLVELKSEDTAIGTCYLTDHVTGRPAEESTLLLLGVYRDEYKKIDGQWFIQNSSLDVVY